jgi:hypothetical protein
MSRNDSEKILFGSPFNKGDDVIAVVPFDELRVNFRLTMSGFRLKLF